jgi:hypothetical protein
MIALLLLLAQEQVDVATKEATWAVPADLTVRARVTKLAPSEPTSLKWRWGGEGLGGSPASGVFGENLAVGAWSEPVPASSFVKGKFPARLFLTVTAGRGGKLARGEAEGYRRMEGQSTGVEVEFEWSWQGKVLKTFTESGPDGGTVGLVIPAVRLAGGKTPADPVFLKELGGLLDHARQRADRLDAALGPAGPAPKRFGIVTDLGGYGSGSYYGIRFTNPAILDAELRTLRRLGVNGFTHAPRFLSESKDFNRLLYAQLGGYPVPAAQKGKEVPEAGCPFAPGVAARTAAMIEEGLAAARTLPVEEVWWRTEDEIGSIYDRAPEGKAHPATCPACARAFRAYLREQGGRAADDVRPLDLTSRRPPGDPLLAYHTAIFANRASAGLFTPLRDALAKANGEKGGPRIYSFALRGNTFLMGGHSLDFFDFYRAADNAFVYETSNRDARIWEWDSYLLDVGRVLAPRLNLRQGVYVKPHRGAPIQRALSAAARGNTMIYWYTYGPEYVKGDTFAGDDAVLAATARAASLLARAEDVLYGAAWAVASEIAVVNPRSSEIWSRFPGGTPAPYENAKWVWTALAHAHLPADPLDEVMLETEDLSRYRVIYVSGPNLTSAAAAKLARWVEAGGTLVTSGGGCARDEADRPLEALQAVLGLADRAPVELRAAVKAYGGTQIESWGPGFDALGAVGREILRPAPGTEVLARYADGGAALTRRTHGKGRACVAGYFPGLEYSAGVRKPDFDMSRDFDAVRRAAVVAPALERVKPVVDASSPLVEGVLLRHPTTGKRSVVLMNWAYRAVGRRTELVPVRDLKVAIRAEAAAVRSTALDRPLSFERSADGVLVTLPQLDEGDILRLD